MLNVERLLASELLAIGTPEECWAAFMLWCRSWKQVPGGSLPSDDRTLAGFSGAGKRWKQVREVALHGFVLCSDGRFYHRFLCEEVKRAYAAHVKYAARREDDRKRLSEWRAKRAQNSDGNADETHFTTGSVVLRQGQGQVSKRKKESPPLPPRSRRSAPGGAVIDFEFGEFWREYPRREDRGHAVKAYKSARAKADQATLVEAAKRYAEQRQGQDQKFTALAASWLNGERWLDESLSGEDALAETARLYREWGVE